MPILAERLLQRLDAARDRHQRRSRVFRLSYTIAGFAVLLIGLITLVTPGPALLIIPLGLFMLALEFAWAERLLQRVLRPSPHDRALLNDLRAVSLSALRWLALAVGIAGAIVVLILL